MGDNKHNAIYKYLIGNLGAEELKSFKDWLDSSAENKKEFEEIKAAWILFMSENKFAGADKKQTWKNILKKTGNLTPEYNSRRVSFAYRSFSRAALLLLAMGIGVILTYFLSTSINIGGERITEVQKPVHTDTILIEAKKGSRSEIILPDGSKVWLNSESHIKMLPSFYAGERTVYLTGEAYFDVARKRDGDFFRVKTSDIQIKVLGTEFNLKSYPEEGVIETTLEEGSVVIEKEINDKMVSLATLAPSEKAIFVKKGGTLNINNTDSAGDKPGDMEKAPRKEHIYIRENIDTRLYTSWKEGHLVFKDESFGDIIKKMERWYGVRIKVNNTQLLNLKFTANFKNETIHQALYALKITHTFEYKHSIEDNLITIK